MKTKIKIFLVFAAIILALTGRTQDKKSSDDAFFILKTKQQLEEKKKDNEGIILQMKKNPKDGVSMDKNTFLDFIYECNRVITVSVLIIDLYQDQMKDLQNKVHLLDSCAGGMENLININQQLIQENKQLKKKLEEQK